MQCTSYRSHVFQHLFWKLLRAWKNGGGVTADFRKPIINAAASGAGQLILVFQSPDSGKHRFTLSSGTNRA